MWNYHLLRCARYNNGGKSACTGHTIRFDAIYELVLRDIQRHTKLVAEDEQTLVDKLYRSLLDGEAKDAKSRDKKIKGLHRNLEALAIKREKLYEEKWERDMDEDIFQSMSQRYMKEKDELETALKTLESEASKTQDKEQDIAHWMENIRQCIGVETLDRQILRLLIERIVVYKKEVVEGIKRQKVEIFYKFVGGLQPLTEQE